MYVHVCAYVTELWNENEEYQEGKKDGGREGGREEGVSFLTSENGLL